MKQKIILSLLIIFIILISLLSCGNSKNDIVVENKTESIQEISYSGIENYEVDCFETLSDIAVKYIPSDKYMSDWIADVKRLNGRKTNDIYFGEVIKVYYF